MDIRSLCFPAMALKSITSEKVKFPRTRHLFDLGRATRDDLLMGAAEAASLLRPNPCLVMSAEEKVDGANLGISWEEGRGFLAKNRSTIIHLDDNPERQFRHLPQWLHSHGSRLRRILSGPGQRVLYGEWMALKHCIHYTRLPDYFLAFDIFDLQKERFFSRRHFQMVLQEANKMELDINGFETPIFSVPQVQVPSTTDLSREIVQKICIETQSQLYDGPVEGIYFRWDDGPWLHHRAKLVQPGFQHLVEEAGHWTKAIPMSNRIDFTKQYMEA